MYFAEHPIGFTQWLQMQGSMPQLDESWAAQVYKDYKEKYNEKQIWHFFKAHKTAAWYFFPCCLFVVHPPNV